MRVDGHILRTMIRIEQLIERIVEIGRTLGIELDGTTKLWMISERLVY